jgi:hypothetical protein
MEDETANVFKHSLLFTNDNDNTMVVVLCTNICKKILLSYEVFLFLREEYKKVAPVPEETRAALFAILIIY